MMNIGILKTMQKLQTIPLIFGVTGHRDIKDPKLVKDSVLSLLSKYKNTYTNTPLVLLSSLADGADTLVAEVAKELGFELHIIFPYEKEEYLKTIKEDKERFETLIKYAGNNIKTLDCSFIEKKIDEETIKKEYTHCYQNMGEYIADTSNILIALWDGKEERLDNGGTAAIVYYQKEHFDKNENMFDSKDGNIIHIIPTTRTRNPNNILNSSEVETVYLGRLGKKDFEKNLDRFDTMNAEISSTSEIKGKTLLHRYKNFFGGQANNNQSKYKKLMIWMLRLIVGAIIFLELMHVLYGVDDFKPWASHLIVGYLLLLFIAWIIYKVFMHTGKLQDDFIFSRGLSEAIRIQNAWNAIELDKSVSDYYLRNEPVSLTWIRMVLKSIHFLDNSHYEPASIWITGQTCYYQREIKNREKQIKKYEKYEHWLFIAGFIGAIVVFIWYFLEIFHVVDHGHFPKNWHFIVLVSGIALLLVGYAKKVLFVQGYEEEKSSFEEILPSFGRAGELLVAGDAEQKKRVVFDLGKKALMENSQWVGLHDARRAKFEME